MYAKLSVGGRFVKTKRSLKNLIISFICCDIYKKGIKREGCYCIPMHPHMCKSV